jgi:hypothetical protein
VRITFSIRLAALAALCIAALATTAALVTVGDANAKGVLATFQTPGTFTWTVPAGVDQVRFDVYGAAGGAGGGNQALTGELPTDPGGLGGQVSAVVNVWPGQAFVFTVGARGKTFCQVLTPTGGCGGVGGGFPDGGPAFSAGGGGGGGSSDVRAGMCALDPTATCRLSTRIVVAGGGGGGGETTRTAPTCAGGGGGGVIGQAGECSSGLGGTQADPCGGISQAGPGGGGGGGWCAGGAGTFGTGDIGYTAGGGGSSWVVVWAIGPVTFNTGVQSGDGKIIITATK